jgi:hypothetical protein
MIVMIEIRVGEGKSYHFPFQSTTQVNELDGNVKATQNYRNSVLHTLPSLLSLLHMDLFRP